MVPNVELKELVRLEKQALFKLGIRCHKTATRPKK